jgi:glucose-1-phosphate thymidylyltransferase
LQKASLFVQAIQERQGIKISCIEEIAYLQGYIDKKQLLLLAELYPSKNEYGAYLRQLESPVEGILQNSLHSFQNIST